MLRHRCAACGKAINRTDHFFEDSDGTLCAACVARQILPGLPRPSDRGTGLAAQALLSAVPPWATLPVLVGKAHS